MSYAEEKTQVKPLSVKVPLGVTQKASKTVKDATRAPLGDQSDKCNESTSIFHTMRTPVFHTINKNTS